MTSPDDLLRSARPPRPPMPDHVRRAIDARLGEAARSEKQRLERNESFDIGPDGVTDDVDVARLDDVHAGPVARRRLPVVAAVVALLVGAVGVAAMAVDRSSTEPSATSVARPAPGDGIGTADDRPAEAAAAAAASPTPEPTPAIDPEAEAILAGLPTAGLAPDRLAAALAGIDVPATGTEEERQQSVGAVIAGVACAWLGHWHDAVGNGDAAEADRALAVFADLESWTALDGPGLGAVDRVVVEVADVVVAAGTSPADVDAAAAWAQSRVCDA